MIHTDKIPQSVTSEGYVMGGINLAVYKVEIIPSEIRLPDVARRGLPLVRLSEECPAERQGKESEVKMMAIKIVGTPKEIAALVLELQGRQEDSGMEALERIVESIPEGYMLIDTGGVRTCTDHCSGNIQG